MLNFMTLFVIFVASKFKKKHKLITKVLPPKEKRQKTYREVFTNLNLAVKKTK